MTKDHLITDLHNVETPTVYVYALTDLYDRCAKIELDPEDFGIVSTTGKIELCDLVFALRTRGTLLCSLEDMRSFTEDTGIAMEEAAVVIVADPDEGVIIYCCPIAELDRPDFDA